MNLSIYIYNIFIFKENSDFSKNNYQWAKARRACRAQWRAIRSSPWPRSNNRSPSWTLHSTNHSRWVSFTAANFWKMSETRKHSGYIRNTRKIWRKIDPKYGRCEEIPIVSFYLMILFCFLQENILYTKFYFKRIYFIIDQWVCGEYFFATKPEYTWSRENFWQAIQNLFTAYSLTVD